MGRSIACVGGPGLGLAAKLCNNYLSGVIAIATSEAMNLGMRLGVDAKVLSGVFRSSSAGNWVNGECVCVCVCVFVFFFLVVVVVIEMVC